MEHSEILSVKSDNTGLAIVQDDLYIGNPDTGSGKDDIIISWQDDTLYIDKYPLTDAMVKVLRMYIDREL